MAVKLSSSSSSSFALSSSSVALSSSVVSSSSKASSSSVATTNVFAQNVADLQLQAKSFRVYDLMGHQLMVSANVPAQLPQGCWVITAIGAHRQKLGSYLKVSE